MSKKPEAPTAAEKEQRFVGDEHWGKGGQFVVVDGKRVPADSVSTASTSEATQQPASTVSVKGGK